MPKSKTDFARAIDDLVQAYSSRSVWMALGWNDVQGRYNRSKVGVLWASLSILIFVAVLGPIYSTLFGVDGRIFSPHLMLGLIVWNYVQGIIMESGREYPNAAQYLISFRLSYFTLLLRVIWRNFVVLCYQMLVFVLFAIVLNLKLSIAWTIVPLALLLITLNALWMGLIMSVFATRYRDLSELMNNIFRLVFFVTPIMWMPGFKPELELVADFNPFYHLIELFRGPLLGGAIDPRSWTIVICMMLVGWLLAFPIFARYRSRIAFWL